MHRIINKGYQNGESAYDYLKLLIKRKSNEFYFPEIHKYKKTIFDEFTKLINSEEFLNEQKWNDSRIKAIKMLRRLESLKSIYEAFEHIRYNWKELYYMWKYYEEVMIKVFNSVKPLNLDEDSLMKMDDIGKKSGIL